MTARIAPFFARAADSDLWYSFKRSPAAVAAFRQETDNSNHAACPSISRRSCAPCETPATEASRNASITTAAASTGIASPTVRPIRRSGGTINRSLFAAR